MRTKLSLARISALLLVCLTIFCLNVTAQSLITRNPQIRAAVDENNRVTLKGNTSPLARPEFDRGAAPEVMPATRMLLVLKRSPDQETALQAFMAQQLDKSSPNYHRWLTPEQFGEQFGPADQDVQAVTSWLGSHGFQVAQVGKGRTVIEFSGTVGQVQETFHTAIHQFNIAGENHWSNVNDPEIPAALAPVIQTVLSLNNFPRKPMHHTLGKFTRSTDTGEVTPLFTGSNSHGSFFALSPADIATIYNIQGLWNAPTPITGTGQSIAVVGETNINIQDVRDFRNLFGLPANDPVIITNGPDPGNLGGDSESEALIDVEWSGAVAKNAQIQLVVSENSATLGAFGIDLSAFYIVDNNLAPVLSSSFGVCEGVGGAAQFYGGMWEQAAAQGITVVVSSGDGGSAACDNFGTSSDAINGLFVNAIASTPFNVAVGGTDFDDSNNPSTFFSATNTTTANGNFSSALSYIPETTWNNSCAQSGLTGCTGLAAGSPLLNIVAGSGGPSINAKPGFQMGVGPSNIANDGSRDLPDVSLFSSNGNNRNNPSFYALCQADQLPAGTSCNSTAPSFQFLGVGGTSVAAPEFAGIMALVNQQLSALGGSPRTGLANPTLYRLAAQQSCNSSTVTPGNPGTCIFYDITKGNNAVPCAGLSPNCSSTTAGALGVLVDPTAPTSPAWSTGAGYDRATGLGSVNAANLASNWTNTGLLGTTTTLTINGVGNSGTVTAVHGTNVTIAVNVAPAGGSTKPTGDVGIVGIAANPPAGIDAGTLTNGATSFQSNQLPGGTYAVTARYEGDVSFNASNSNTVNVSVSKENSATAVTFTNAVGGAISASAPYGSGILYRVDVSNAAKQLCTAVNVPCPTGTVAVTDNGNALNDFGGTNVAPLTADGFLEDQSLQLSTGAHSIVATYNGDNSFTGSASNVNSITITKAQTSTFLQSSLLTVTSGQTVTLTASIGTASNGAAPTGSVTFMSGSNTLGTVPLTGLPGSNGFPASGTATLTAAISLLPPPAAPGNPTNRRFEVRWFILGAALILMMVLGWFMSWAPGLPRRWRFTFAASLVCAIGMFAAGCGSSGGGGGGNPAGNRGITAVYSGDANYTGTTSSVVTITVN